MTLAVVLSLLAPRAVPFDLPSFLVDGSLINLRTLIVLLIIGLLVGIGVLLVLAVKTGQLRLGVYLLAVALWVAVLVILSRVVPGTTALNIDLALTLLLLIAAVAWMRGRQHLVDGFEIIVTVVVLSVLIELPMVLDMLPEPTRRALLIAALLTPAIASIWKHLSGLEPELAGRPALRGLAVMCHSGRAGQDDRNQRCRPDQQPERPDAELAVGAHCAAAGGRRQRRAARRCRGGTISGPACPSRRMGLAWDRSNLA
jgi:hypothetical protein